MKRKNSAPIFCVGFVLFASLFAQAQVTSTFNTDADAWTASDINLQLPLTPTHNATGGNPNGNISVTTPTGQPYYFTSPAKFNGNIAYLSYGQELSFDIFINYAPATHSAHGDVLIMVGQSWLSYTLPSFPTQNAWKNFKIKLDETVGWRYGGPTGALATKQEIKQYLSGLSSIKIFMNYAGGFISASLDNVIINQRTPLPSPTVSSIGRLSGAVGTSITINGNNFDATVGNNAVYFGGMAGTITNASATQLVVTVPSGAQYGAITVINKTTGLSKQSAQPFNPTFVGGGRIIPASFNPKVDILTSVQTSGLAMADVDGDGWNDIIVAGNTNVGVDVYRNLGLGGNLTSSSFAAKVSFATGGVNVSLKVIDLDGDGKLDIVTSVGKSFATLRNISTSGNLAFESVEYWDGKSDRSPVYGTADIDGDGLPELFGGNGNGGAGQNVWITQNMSSPSNIEFGYSLFYFSDTVDDAPSGVSISDLDNDGKPEFILKRSFNSIFTVFVNTSTPGVISFGTNFSITQGSDGNINVADFNQDGKNDLAWKQGFPNGMVNIRINTNSGGVLAATDFATEVILPSDLSSYGGLSLGDINGDGKTDIMAADGSEFGVFENVYTGGAFSSSSFVSAYKRPGGSFYPTTIVAGDLNGDTKPDLVFSSTDASSRISIIENKNVHTPVISLTTVSPLAGAVGSTVTITGDYFSTLPSENTVIFGHVKATVTGATKTQLTVTVPAGASTAPVSVTRNQLTAIYHLPFVPTFSSGVTFVNTHFAPPVNFTLTGAGYDLDAGDLNNDGKPDVMADVTVAQAYAFRNMHTTGNISATSLAPDDTLSSGPYPHLMDLDGDGYMDMLSGVGPFRNASTGTEINFNTYSYINPGGYYYNDFADFNMDGKTDFIGVYNGGTHVSVNENQASFGPFASANNAPINTFSISYNYIKPGTGGSVVAGDFDKDGLTDFAATNSTTDNVTVWKNNGAYQISTTQFTAQPNITVGDNPGRIYSSDLDLDGKVDLVLYHGAGTTTTMITVLHNQSTVGTISFSRFDYTIPAAATVAHINDLDGDGKPEIIVTSTAGNRFVILKNTSSPGVMNATSFAAPFSTTVTTPRGITTGDLNLDGKPEIIITAAPNSLLVFENLVPIGPSISINPQPLQSTICNGASTTFTTTATGTTSLVYQWQHSTTLAGTYSDIANGTGYSNVATSTLTVSTTGNFGAGFYRCQVSGDLATTVFSNAAQLTINALPTAPTTTGASACVSGSVIVNATGGSNGQYRWYTVAAGGTSIAGEVNSAYTTPTVTSATNYFVSINNGTCESTRTPVTATITTTPPPTTTGASACAGNTFTLTASGGANGQYKWYPVATGGTAIALQVNGSYTTPALNSTTNYFVSITIGTCESTRTPVTATIIATGCTPVITPTPLATQVEGKIMVDLKPLIITVGTLDVNSIKVISPPQSGATASIANGVLTIDYAGKAFSGKESIRIEACNTIGACTQTDFEIEVAGDIVVYNALSPGSDGKNDIFYLEYINILEATKTNRVVIFNRWGDVVFDVENYDNTTKVFRGLSNDGKELPSGVYFYKIDFASGAKGVDGFISVRR